MTVPVPEEDLPPLDRAAQMLERITQLSVTGSITEKMPALQYTVHLAAAHALGGIGQELAAIHDHLRGGKDSAGS